MAGEPREEDLQRWHALAPGTILPVEDFVGPLEVQNFLSQGRGLVATEDCAPGRLLIVSHAFILARKSNLEEAAVKALKAADALGKQRFCALEGGLRNTESNHLSFWCGTNHISQDQAGNLGKGAVLEILRRNSFALTQVDESRGDLQAQHGGVWLVPSLLNHDCMPNSASVFLGDTLFIRAARLIRAGEEITYAYCGGTQGRIERQAALARYNFSCTCLRCQLESFVAPRRLEAPAALNALLKAQATVPPNILYKEVLRTAADAETDIVCAPLKIREEAEAQGLDMGAAALAAYFDVLMFCAGSLDRQDPQFLAIMELLAQTLAAVQPGSPGHVFCCNFALTAHGSAPLSTTALAAAALRAKLVHVLCYGGGDRLWKQRLKGSPAAPFAAAASESNLPISPVTSSTPACVIRLSSSGLVISFSVLAAENAADVVLDVSPSGILISHRAVSAHIALFTHISEELAKATFVRARRRLELSAPWKSL